MQRTLRRATVAVAVLGLSASAVTAGAVTKTGPRVRPPTPDLGRVLPHTLMAPAARRTPAEVAEYNPAVASRLPGAGTGVADLAAAASTAATKAATKAATASPASSVRAGTLPVFIGRDPRAAAAKAGGALARGKVTLADQHTAQAAGIHGILFSVTSADASSGPATVTVDPSSFAAAYGGDYAARLHLVRMPACALTTPALPQCRTQTPLAPVNGSPLTTALAVNSAATVLAATSGTSGSSGSYAASSLSPAGTWSVGGNTGSFNYSYPLQVPAAIAGATPSLSLDYDSSSQDGRTEGTNNQSSWLGDGWSTSEGYIERTYRSCSDDSTSGAPKYSGDECWAGQILTLSLNGQSTQIVYDDTTHTFHPAADSGTEKIERLTGANNGTHDGEYWRVTENGVQFYFGMNQLPGYASGDRTTQSAWTVPVYGAHSGDPCNASTFAASSCLQGWRWNLDYVVDLHNNATAYYYQPETNYYGADMQTTGVPYTRGGYLTRIDYGMTASTVYSGTAPEQVVFNVAERCVPGVPSGNTCSDSQFTVADASYWPDVPIDLNCASGATCDDHAPSFWSRKRLTSIVTQVQSGGATHKVDQYTFAQSFPDGGDHAPTLWLDSIQRTGLDTLGGATASTSNPVTSFDPPLQLPNRVGTIANLPVMYHDRISTITSETGAQTTVTYNPTTCTTSNVPSDPSTNTMPCFPVYWTPTGATAPELDWFFKYTVGSVLVVDPNTKNPDNTQPELLTSYTYDGGAAWHYDDNEVVKAADRTYGQFRGYAAVETRTGDPNVFHYTNGVKVYDQKSLTVARYLRGMDGDTLPGGGTRSVTVSSLDGAYSVKDSDALAGTVFEQDAYASDGGALDHATVSMPTIIGPTASRARTGLPALTAQMVRTAASYTRQAVTGGWRHSETDQFYTKTLGQPTTGLLQQTDDRGDTSDPANIPQCSYSRYAVNSTRDLVFAAESLKVQQDCSSAGATPSGTLISDSRTSYDGHGFTWDGLSGGTAPTAGDTTETDAASAASGASPTAFVTQQQATYDAYGRVLTQVRTPLSTAADGTSLAQTVRTTYTPATGLPTQIQVSKQVTAGASPTYQTTTTTYDPARALPTEVVDPAGRKTDTTYDALGRTTAVWRPNESKAAGQSPNTSYSYLLSTTGPSIVTTKTLQDDGSYSVSEALQDALGRARQTQSTGENGTTVVTDTQYDSHGWKVVENKSYAVSGAPATQLVSVAQNSLPAITVTDHDAMGRPDQATEEHLGQQTSVTTTAYAGDHTTVVNPTGAVTQTTYTNARGQTTELDQYTAAPTVSGTAATGFAVSGGSTNKTAYSYTATGKTQTVTGPDGQTWTSRYDLLGRKVSQTDPDAGTMTYAFDDAGDQIATTDSRGVEIDYGYDLLGRRLTSYDKAKGYQMAAWTYDTVQAGQLSSSTRYEQGVSGGYTISFNGYTALGKPTGETYTLPSSEAPLPTTYTISYSYAPVSGELTSQTEPKTAGLLGEIITYKHDSLGNPTSTSGIWTYVGGTAYTATGQIGQLTLGPTTAPAWVTNSFDDQTQRLTKVVTTRSQGTAGDVDSTSYRYDAAGNPLVATDVQTDSGTAVTDQQCYSYNPLAELAGAWTANDTCAANPPTAASLATGPDAYYQSYSYDLVGDRTSETDHAVDGASADTTTTYTDGCTANCSFGTQQHTLTALNSTGPAGASSVHYGYDAMGDTVAVTPSAGTGQTLAWDDEGHLQKVTQGTDTTSYLYDASGNELIRRDPGQTTLFVGDTEIVVNTSTTPATLAGAVRTYHSGGSGAAIAVRSSLAGGGVDYLVPDLRSESTVAMDVTTQAVTRRAYTPFGQPRGAASSGWPDPVHGYLGKPVDSATGYTDIGAREYDPATGRFLSVDPVLEAASPRQLGGYAYAADNPTGTSDPTGLDDWWADPSQNAGVSQTVADAHGYGANCLVYSCSSADSSTSSGSQAAGILSWLNAQLVNDKRHLYTDVLKEFFDGQIPSTSRQGLIGTTGTAPGNGIILVRFFINSGRILGFGHGDYRDFSSDPNASSRVVVAWNTDTGQITMTAQKSCVDLYCHSARDINTPGSLNTLHVTTSWGAQGSDGGHVGFIADIHATDAIVNFGASIHGTLGLDVSPGGKISFQYAGTRYPSIEAYQYYRDSAKDPRTLGTSLEWPNNFIGPMIGLHDASRRLAFSDGVQSQDPNLVFLSP